MLPLFLAFTLIPIVELALLVWTGSWLGPLPTIGLVIGTALLGSFFAKREGLRVFREYQAALAEMRMPEEGLTSGLLVLVAGVLLISPGVLTDLVGILLMIPAIRKHVAHFIEARLAKSIEASRSGNATVTNGPFGFRFVQVRTGGPVRHYQAPTADGTGTVEVIDQRPRSQRPAAPRLRGVIDAEGEVVDEHER